MNNTIKRKYNISLILSSKGMYFSIGFLLPLDFINFVRLQKEICYNRFNYILCKTKDKIYSIFK